MTIKPIGKRVLIVPFEPDRQSSGGIVFPAGYDTTEQCPASGVVIAISAKAKCACDKADCDVILPGVKEGTKVLFHRFDGTTINYQNKTCILVEAKDIKGIIE